jgi:hypothetical protein
MSRCRHTRDLLPHVMRGAASVAASATASGLQVVYVPEHYYSNRSEVEADWAEALHSSAVQQPKAAAGGGSGSALSRALVVGIDRAGMECAARLERQYRVIGYPWVVLIERTGKVCHSAARLGSVLLCSVLRCVASSDCDVCGCD